MRTIKFSNNSYISYINFTLLKKKDLIIPDFQRDLDNDRVDEIYNKLLKNKELINIIGVITICELDNIYYLVDGQHRYHALNKLKVEKILIHEIKVGSKEELINIFTEINQNTPLPNKWLEITDTNKIKHKKLLKEFKKIYPLVLVQSNKPRPPNIKKTDFENILLELPYININHINDLNKIYKNSLKDNIEKYEKKNFYLSIVNTDTLKEDLIKIFNNKEIEIKNNQYKKVSIPVSLKTSVWEKFTDKYSIKCPISFCNKKINARDFDCGHIKSERNGGKLELDNLKPICHPCNCSMGIKNWNIYDKKK